VKRSTLITWDQLRVGALILFALAIVAAAIVTLGSSTNLFAKRYRLVAFLPSASGLTQGGQVTVAGQLAGVIDAIDFLPVDADTMRNLRIVVAVDRAMRSQIRGDSRAKIRTLGLLGDKVFDIIPGTPGFQPLNEWDTLSVEPAVDYEEVLSQASGAMNDVMFLTRDLREITAGVARGEGTLGQMVTNRELYDQMNATLSRTSTLMARLQNPAGSFGQLLDDPALYRNAVRLLTTLDTTLTLINSSDGTLGRLMRDDSLYMALVGTVEGANALVRQIGSGQGTAARLVNDPRLYDELVKSVTDLNAILEDVRRDPRRYTRGLIEIF
jgi:phospholipid/cholesterol/gamma-HCH transport system substrate-binding protein